MKHDDNRTNDNSKFIYIRQATKQGFIPMLSGNVADLSYPNSKIRRGRVQGKYGNVSPTLTCGGNAIYKIDMEINNMNISTKENYQDNQNTESEN